MKIEYHPFTVDDLSDAEIHYDQLRPGLSQAFRAEVIQTIEQVKDRPFFHRLPRLKQRHNSNSLDSPSQTSPSIWKWETVTCSKFAVSRGGVSTKYKLYLVPVESMEIPYETQSGSEIDQLLKATHRGGGEQRS